MHNIYFEIKGLVKTLTKTSENGESSVITLQTSIPFPKLNFFVDMVDKHRSRMALLLFGNG